MDSRAAGMSVLGTMSAMAMIAALAAKVEEAPREVGYYPPVRRTASGLGPVNTSREEARRARQAKKRAGT